MAANPAQSIDNARRVAVVAGGRTPFVKAGKSYKALGPLKLACHAVKGLIERHGTRLRSSRASNREGT